jgi:hypothetical protein
MAVEKQRTLREKVDPVPHFPPQIPHDLPWASTVRSSHLATRATAHVVMNHE